MKKARTHPFFLTTSTVAGEQLRKTEMCSGFQHYHGC